MGRRGSTPCSGRTFRARWWCWIRGIWRGKSSGRGGGERGVGGAVFGRRLAGGCAESAPAATGAAGPGARSGPASAGPGAVGVCRDERRGDNESCAVRGDRVGGGGEDRGHPHRAPVQEAGDELEPVGIGRAAPLAAAENEWTVGELLGESAGGLCPSSGLITNFGMLPRRDRRLYGVCPRWYDPLAQRHASGEALDG